MIDEEDPGGPPLATDGHIRHTGRPRLVSEWQCGASPMNRGFSGKFVLRFSIVAVIVAIPATSFAGPNLIAMGQYDAVPFARAEGRVSFSGNEVIFQFEDPELDFGRVVVRSNQPLSVVRRDLFVGFNGEGLFINTQNTDPGGGTVQVREVELWLRIKGVIREGQSYEWEMEGGGSQERNEGIPAVIPVLWADGDQIGAEVTIRQPELEDADKIVRLLFPHGVVRIPRFERQTGAAWIVLKPNNFGSSFALRRFSFREVDTELATDDASSMPIPVRYIPIRSVLEDGVAEVLDRCGATLKPLQNDDGSWGSGSDIEQIVIETAYVADALAELDPHDDHVKRAIEWLAAQEPADDDPWGTGTVAARLHCMARHGGMADFERTVRKDSIFLSNAQCKDGGWTLGLHERMSGDAAAVQSDHESSLRVLLALLEARFAGAAAESRVWKQAMRYWTDAQTYDGGFSEKLARYGGVGETATSAHTATGAAALITALDMASGMGGRRCSTYRASAFQLRAIGSAIAWLEDNFTEELRTTGSFVTPPDPYLEPERMQFLGSASGISHFNNKNHFVESARSLLRQYDRGSAMFGVRGADGKFVESPSVLRTARALSILGSGAAPTICQRIIVGDKENGWGQYRGDVQHLVRYLAGKRGRQFNWRRTTIDSDIRCLAEVPILLLSFVGPFSWSQEEWGKIREYSLAGGSVVVAIDEGAADQRQAVLAGLRDAFPEYELSELSKKAPIFDVETSDGRSAPAVEGVLALGNGFRDFVFVAPESWPCQWHLNQVEAHRESFAFMDRLLTYATDGSPPRSSFAASTYAMRAASSKSMTVAHLQIGAALPAYPNLLDTMDRLMQSNYRVSVVETADPSQADLVWVNITGEAPPSESARASIRRAIRNGKYLFLDVVSGNRDWDESFQTVLREIDDGISLQKLRRTDPLFTGEIAGTQGFDATRVSLRRSLQTRFTKVGRCDLYAITRNETRVGVYSAHDVSSGIGYHYFPGCRGPMPADARKLAMNVFLTAYDWKINGRPSE